MAACVALTDGRDPCRIICSKGKKPERQLYCDLREKVLPRLRNLVQLLHAKVSWPLPLQLLGLQILLLCRMVKSSPTSLKQHTSVCRQVKFEHSVLILVGYLMSY